MKLTILLFLFLVPSFAILLQPGYFPIHDDLQIMRQFEMNKCISDGQIPCRWVPDMGYGFGYPLFNFYPPFPYYLGQLVHTLGWSFIDTAKIIGILGFVVSGLGMYLLAREFWGTWGALISSVMYVYAPYHSVDFYVRAAINEFWAIALFPFAFWTTYRLIKDQSAKWIPAVAVSIGLLLLCHNPLFMIFAPGYLVWIAYWAWHFKLHKSLKLLTLLSLSALWALGLAAFFTLPVLFEAKYAHVETLVIGYFNYLAHFTDIKQLFLNINWGYGASFLGPGDELSFALGYLHWFLPLIISIFIFKFPKFRSLLAILILSILLSLFLSHSKSTEIWKLITPLQYLQFPWRFLSLAIFYSSFVSGAIVYLFKSRFPILCILILILCLNAFYFVPRYWNSNLTDQAKLTGESWHLAQTASIFDYLPIWAPLPPAKPPTSDLEFVDGEGKFRTLAKTSNFQQYITVSAFPTQVEIQTMYFPGWRLWVDDREVAIDPTQDKLLGRIQTSLTPGTHSLTLRFTNTPIRTVGNTLSILSWLALATIWLVPKLRQKQSQLPH